MGYRWESRAAFILSMMCLVGCAPTPLPQLHEGDIPAEWHRADNDDDYWPDANWWDSFSSDELSEVIALVEERSLGLASNARNLELAQLALRDAGFALRPTPIVDFGGSRNYSGFEPNGGNYTDGGTESFDLSARISYTDILSKKTTYEVARARFESSVASYASVRLNILGTAASTYFRILLLRDRMVAAEKNLENAERLSRIVNARVEAGTVNKIDLLQQQIAVQRQKNNLSSLRQSEFAAHSALALLLADSVYEIEVKATTLDDIAVPDVIPGIPASLLTRRPDIVQSEADLRVSRASVDLARLAYLPNISITGSVRLLSDSLDELLGRSDTSASANASLAQLILDNGSRGRNVERSRLRLETALANYRQTVISAFNEIEVALGNIELLRALGAVAADDEKRSEEAFRIAEARYREGVGSYQTVLSSQNALFSARDSVLINKLAQLNAIVALYQLLGGGWEKPES